MKKFRLYIDESGVPELSSKTKYCLFTGVLVDEDLESAYSFLINNLKDKYKIPLDKHLHTVDLFENTKNKNFLGTTRRRPLNDLRKKFQVDFWNIIKECKFKYFTVIIDKSNAYKILELDKRSDNGDLWIKGINYYAHIDSQLPLDIGMNVLYSWALKNTNKGSVIKIICEARHSDHFTIRNFTNIQSKEAFKNKLMKTFSNNVKDRITSITFANKSSMYSGLEISDFICYTCNVYLIQLKKRAISIDRGLKGAISFPGIHMTLNNHYKEIDLRMSKKFTPGISKRLKRIRVRYMKNEAWLKRNKKQP